MGENYREKYSEYLKHKHSGGISNRKGNAYEAIYATKEIIRLLLEKVNPETTFLSAQLENEFVDDFWIKTPDNLEIFHQLKNSQKLCWGRRDSKKN